MWVNSRSTYLIVFDRVTMLVKKQACLNMQVNIRSHAEEHLYFTQVKKYETS